MNNHKKSLSKNMGQAQAGKQAGFSHVKPALTRLFPHDSTQVVDFPHMAMARLFRGVGENSRILAKGMIGRGMRENF